MSKRKYNRFGHGGCYRCGSCGKLTRETDPDAAFVGVCEKCYYEGGLINEHSDRNGQHMGYEKDGGFNPDCPTCRAERKEKEGSNGPGI